MSAPKPPNPLNEDALAEVLRLLAGPASTKSLNAALRHLAKWRAQLVGNTVVAQSGITVQAGPFAGLIYDAPPNEAGRVPRLLGCDLAALGPVIEDIIARAPRLLIDVGCGDGFRAVGFARRLPRSTVWARDANPQALTLCETLAGANGVAGRVKTGGLLTHADFDICRAQPTCVICAISGGEDALLDPDRAKGLRRADILVEVREAAKPGLADRIAACFESTHQIARLDREADTRALPDWMHTLSDLDRLLALWEGRGGPAPWLWMQAKHR